MTFEKRRVICFLVIGDVIHIIAVFGTSQDWEGLLSAKTADLAQPKQPL